MGTADGTAGSVTFDDPVDLAAQVASRPRPLVVGLDVDGVLAPIVDHADDARLAPGIHGLLVELDAIDAVEVAVVSGRALAGLEQFGFAPELTVIGGHGGQVRGEPDAELTPEERSRLDELDRLAERAAEHAGDGAWVERKPTSVVLHVREAASPRGREALDRLGSAAANLEGVKATPGSEVLEVFARPASKATAIDALRALHAPRSIVYAGDDVTDEEAFAALGEGDLTIKVGPGATAATYRLRDTDAVTAWLAATVTALGRR